VHQKQASETLLLSPGGVDDGVALFQGAGVDAQVGQFPDVRVGLDLEGEGREGLVVRGLSLDDLVLARLGALVGGRSIGEGKKSTTASSMG